MVALVPEDISRCRFHLGYSAMDSIPDGDEMRFYHAVTSIRDAKTAQYIRYMLDALDDAFTAIMENLVYDSRQIIQGDVNRSTVVDTPNDLRVWLEQYYKKCDLLAQTLNVAGYHRPVEAKYRFVRQGSVSVFPSFGHPLGPADTIILSKLEASTNYA